MNLSQLIAEVRQHGFGDELPDTRIVGWLNDALSEIAAAAPDWPWLEASNPSVPFTAGQNSSSLATTDASTVWVARAIACFITGAGARLGWLEPADFFELGQSTGTPSNYTVYGTSLLVWPTPVAPLTLTLYYQAQPTMFPALFSGTETCQLPERHQRTLVYGAAARGFQELDDNANYDRVGPRYTSRLKQMVSDLQTRSLDRPSAVGQAGYAWTLSQLRQEVRGHGFDLPNAVIDELLNDAMFEACSRHPWPFLKAVTPASGPGAVIAAAGNPVVTLPIACAKPIKVIDARNNWRLCHVDLDERVESYWGGADESATGQPETYAVWGQDPASGAVQIRVWPAPDCDRVLEVLYLRTPDPLITPTQAPAIPQRHRRVVLMGAISAAAEMSPDPNVNRRAGELRASFENRLERMAEDLLNAQLDRDDRILRVASDDYDYLGD